MRPVVMPLAALVVLAGTAPSAQAQANGRNAVFIEYRNDQGMVGAFRQMRNGMWLEQNAQGRNSFREQSRDDWSVYLRDESRGVNIQLDLHTRRVNYSDSRMTTPSQIYGITRAFEWGNGRNTTRVIAGADDGREVEFVQAGPGSWIERNLSNNQTTFQFRETNRDDWTVYLHDASRNVNLYLDMHRRQVLYSQGGAGAPQPIYTITTALGM